MSQRLPGKAEHNKIQNPTKNFITLYLRNEHVHVVCSQGYLLACEWKAKNKKNI